MGGLFNFIYLFILFSSCVSSRYLLLTVIYAITLLLAESKILLFD